MATLLMPRSLPQLQEQLLSILPRPEIHGRVNFRHLACPHRKADAIAEMVAIVWKWFIRRDQQGKDGQNQIDHGSVQASR